MKKILPILCLLVLSTSTTFGETKQTPRNLAPSGKHEISLNYGFYSHNEALGEWINIGPFGLAQRDLEYTGSIGIEYLYYPINQIGVGATCLYEYGHASANVHEVEHSSHHHYITLMPTAKFYWFNTSRVGMYSRVGVGATYVVGKYNGMPDNDWRFAFQASAVSVEAGTNIFRAFVELGYGTQGVLLAGFRVRF